MILDNPLSQHLYDGLLLRIPEEKRIRIARFRSFPERQVRLLADLLVRVRVCEQFHLKNNAVRIDIDPGGKPFLSGLSGQFQYSVSHTKGAILAAFDSRPVGADIEAIRTVHPAVVRRYFSVQEQAYAAPCDLLQTDRALEIWTAKEAFAKLLGTGLPRVFSEADTLRTDFPYSLHRMRDESYIMTVCTEEKSPCLFKKLSSSQLIQQALSLSVY